MDGMMGMDEAGVVREIILDNKKQTPLSRFKQEHKSCFAFVFYAEMQSTDCSALWEGNHRTSCWHLFVKVNMQHFRFLVYNAAMSICCRTTFDQSLALHSNSLWIW